MDLRRGGRRARFATLTALLALAAVLVGPGSAPVYADTAAPSGEQTLTVAVGAELDGTPVSLDASVFTPVGEGSHPAVLLAHGFGGSKADLADQARDLATRG